MKATWIDDLAAMWETEAQILEANGAPELATAKRRSVAQLREKARAFADEVLTLQAAAAETGKSYKALEKAVRTNRLPNAGEKQRPRVRRADLWRSGEDEHASGPQLVRGKDGEAGRAFAERVLRPAS